MQYCASAKAFLLHRRSWCWRDRLVHWLKAEWRLLSWEYIPIRWYYVAVHELWKITETKFSFHPKTKNTEMLNIAWTWDDDVSRVLLFGGIFHVGWAFYSITWPGWCPKKVGFTSTRHLIPKWNFHPLSRNLKVLQFKLYCTTYVLF